MMHGSGTAQSAPAQASAVLPDGSQEAKGVEAISRSSDIREVSHISAELRVSTDHNATGGGEQQDNGTPPEDGY